jgi:histidine ammonia-lyase
VTDVSETSETPAPRRGRLVLGGRTLTPAALVAAVRTAAAVEVSPAARQRVVDTHALVARVAEQRTLYARATGVGGNRDQTIERADQAEHSRRVIASHAGGTGPPLDDDAVRATIIVRANQIAAGGSGLPDGILDALVALLDGPLPPVPSLGSLGTGDLTALAAIARALDDGVWGPGDGPAFLSSGAATVAVASLAAVGLRELLAASLVVAATSARAMSAQTDPFAEAVVRGRPHPGSLPVAALLRELVAPPTTARLQDAYAVRCLPAVVGAALDAVDLLDRTLAIELNAAGENPLFAEGEAWHHGSFHQASLALALDHVRLGLAQVASLAAARLAHLMDPAKTGLRPYLGAAPGASGALILEYVAHAALDEIVHAADPATRATAVLAGGQEDHASFAWQAAERARVALDAGRVLVAAELVAARRARRQQGAVDDDVVRLASELAWTDGDRPLDGDVASGVELLPALVAMARDRGFPA